MEFEIAHGLIFLLLPVFMSIGAITYFYLTFEPNGWKIVGWLTVCAGVVYLTRNKRPIFYFFAFVFFILIGGVCAKVETYRLQTSMLGADVSTYLTARIVSIETLDSGRTRLLLDVIDTKQPFLRFGPQRVRLSARSIPDNLKPGDGVRGLVRLNSVSGPVRPESYDFGFYNYFRFIGAQGFFLSKIEQVTIEPPKSVWQKVAVKIEQLRVLMTNRIVSAIDGGAGSVSAALITGQRGGISEATNHALRVSGLAHILSISGLHMAMVSGMVLVIVRSIFSCFPIFSSRYPTKKYAAFIALCVSGFYLVLSGADVAAQRSFIMVAVMLTAVFFDRTAITLRNLSIAFFITLLLVPHEILRPSFQMSFSATAALVAAFSWWSRRAKRRRVVPQFVGVKIISILFFPFVSTAVASLVAGMASGLYASYHFANAAPLGILSNALAFPIMSLIVMPFGLLAVIVMPLGLEWFPLQVMGFGVDIVEKIAYEVTDKSPDINPGVIPSAALMFLTLGLIVLLFFKTKLRLFSIIFFIIGISMCFYRIAPILLISEDARLIGLLENKTLYLNRKRPSKFVTSIWKRSYRVNTIIGPTSKASATGFGFSCEDNVCYAQNKKGIRIAVVDAKDQTYISCPKANIIIISTPTYLNNCHAAVKYVIQRNQLALYGSMVITSNDRIIQSVPKLNRPWNNYRLYSRAARGL